MKKVVSDLPDDRYSGRCVFVRVNFNVPIHDGQIQEDYRLRRAIPTIEYLSQRGAKVVLASHLGKPRGTVVPELSLKPVAIRLGQMLKVPAVKFAGAVIGESVKQALDAMKPREILLLENLRFERGEELNDPVFAKRLASLAEVYVNDAFGTIHRAHASTYGAAQLFSDRLAGFLVSKEMEVLSQVRDYPFRPFRVVVGGIKIKDKALGAERAHSQGRYRPPRRRDCLYVPGRRRSGHGRLTGRARIHTLGQRHAHPTMRRKFTAWLFVFLRKISQPFWIAQTLGSHSAVPTPPPSSSQGYPPLV